MTSQWRHHDVTTEGHICPSSPLTRDGHICPSSPVRVKEINMSSKMGDPPFKLWMYNSIFLEIWAQIPIWAPMLKRWAVGSFYLAKILQKISQRPPKVNFFHKNKSEEKWWSWWLRMTNAFILCNLLWKVQKNLAANRECSFTFSICDCWWAGDIKPCIIN